jgi:hypothetical protein
VPAVCSLLDELARRLRNRPGRPLAQGHSKLMAQHQDLGFNPQAEDHHTSGRAKTGPAPTPERGAEPTAICRAPAQVTQVFGTRRSSEQPFTLRQEVSGLMHRSAETPQVGAAVLVDDGAEAGGAKSRLVPEFAARVPDRAVVLAAPTG